MSKRESAKTGGRRRLTAAAVCVLLSTTALGAATEYRVDLARASAGIVGIEIEADCAPPECVFEMPAWNATYQLRDFARFVPNVEAVDADGRAVAVRKTGPSRWRVSVERAGGVRLRYSVRADRPGPFGVFADSRQVTLNLGQVLLYPLRGADEEFRLRFENRPEAFQEALSLQTTSGGYRADSYAALIDTPVHLSAFEERWIEIAGKRVRVVVFGEPGAFNLDLLTATVRRLFEAALRLMGDLPFETYTVVYVFADVDGGGMEYLDGTLIFGPADCATCNMASLTAHEIFHLWNVKRIRPRSMEPPNFSRAQPSPSLWFAEGVSSTYAAYLQAMAGMLGPEQMLAQMEKLIADYMARPARLTQSAEEAGVEAWLERYPRYSGAGRSVSYYLRGDLIGRLLDLSIRRNTHNARSLDDVLRLLDLHYGKTGRPYDDTAGLEAALVEIGGGRMRNEVEDLVRSAAPVDWGRYLSYAGCRLERRVVERTETGLTVAAPPGRGVVVAAVASGSPAEAAGLRVGDRVLRIAGRRPSGGAQDVRRRLRKSSGKRVALVVERRGVEVSLELRPRRGRATEFHIVPLPDADDLQLEIRRGWAERWTSPRPASSSE